MKEVVCIDNIKRLRELTVGKKYKVLKETPLMYEVFNDRNKVIKTLKERFILKEVSKENVG